VKMPDPITAPIPSAVSDHGPSDFLSACSGSSDSRISLSMDLQASSWLGRAVFLFPKGSFSQDTKFCSGEERAKAAVSD